MKNELAQIMYSISLKARIIREHQKTKKAAEQEFSERELFALELIGDYGPITEKGLCNALGLSFSSIGELVKNLGRKGAVDTSEKIRGEPLRLTKQGKELLKHLKLMSSLRFQYLFDSPDDPLTENEHKVLMQVFQKVESNADRHLQQEVFDRYTP